METFSKRLKKAMNLRGLKQTDLVKKTGINKGALSCYLKGTYEPKQKNIHLLANALNVSEGWLMGFETSIESKIDIDKIIENVSNKTNIDKDYIYKRYKSSIFSTGELELTEKNLENLLINDLIFFEELEDDYYESLTKKDAVLMIINKALEKMNYTDLKNIENDLRKKFPDKFDF